MAESKSAPFILTDLYSYSVGSSCNYYENKISFKSCLTRLGFRVSKLGASCASLIKAAQATFQLHSAVVVLYIAGQRPV